MKNPSHPGRIVKGELDERGLGTDQAATALDITGQELHRFLSGESDVSSEMAVRLEKVIGGSAKMWLRMQASYDSAQTRRSPPT